MPQPMRDVIVLVPGILGSVLVKDGREVWGVSGHSITGNLLTFGRALKSLELEPGVGHGDPQDEVSAPRMLPRLFMIPTFWKADGYGSLRDRGTVFGVTIEGHQAPQELTVRGWQRAGVLATFFAPPDAHFRDQRIEKPLMIFASRVAPHSKSLRPNIL